MERVPLPRRLFQVDAFYSSRLVAVGKDAKVRRQTVFFTVLDPMSKELDAEYQDLSRPRKVQYKCKC